MTLESSLGTLASELSNFLDLRKLASDGPTYEGFCNNILKIFPNLPASLKPPASQNIDNLKCRTCKSNSISNFTQCSHGYCNFCYKLVENGYCSCGSLSSPEKSPHKCILCNGDLDPAEINCPHYCHLCIIHLSKSQTDCNICQKPLHVAISSGKCGNCHQLSDLNIKVCNWHKHCLNCSEKDLRKMRCSECTNLLHETDAARIICMLYPKCTICKNRKKITAFQKCCKKSYCYLCFSTHAYQNCLCGQQLEPGLSKYINDVRIAEEKFISLFDIILIGVVI